MQQQRCNNKDATPKIHQMKIQRTKMRQKNTKNTDAKNRDATKGKHAIKRHKYWCQKKQLQACSTLCALIKVDLFWDIVVGCRWSAESILKPSLLVIRNCNFTVVVLWKVDMCIVIIKQNLSEQICDLSNFVPNFQQHLFWRLHRMRLGTVWTLFHPLWTFELLLGHIKHPFLGDGNHSENQE